MKIFVVNCGSSSIKYQLFSMTKETVLSRGIVERVGEDDAVLRHTVNHTTYERHLGPADHATGMKYIIEALLSGGTGVIKSIDEIEGVGHRVVHGGEDMYDSHLIDDEVIGIIERNAELAPLHNPPNLAGIRAARAAMPDVPHAAVFDTAFLATLPPRAYRYAVPQSWYRDYHVRKYGFHGTSHRYVTLHAAELLGVDAAEVNLITVHLGNGCSMTAVAGGKAVDHSMGMTPLEGLVMGTRCGDIDPAIPLYMVSHGMDADEVDRVLNKESGLLGVSGCSNDMRDLLAAAGNGDEGAELAVEMFVYRIVKYIGAYHAILPSLHAVALTGGIGENSVPVRRGICDGLAGLGVTLDEARNEETVGGEAGPVTSEGSTPPVWVVPTNEELMIARDTRRIATAQD